MAGTLFVAGRQGLQEHRRRLTWKDKNAGLASLNVRSLALSPRIRRPSIWDERSGLYRSRDGGKSGDLL